MKLTTKGKLLMKINYTYRVLVLLCTFVLAFILLPIIASAVDPISGISVTASSATSGPSLSNGTITITRKGGLFNSSTATITIKNTGKVTANISFTYAHSGSGSATLNGVSATSGTYSGTLAADATVTMTLKGAGGYATGTLKLSNFSWTEVSNDAKATITYDASMGSVSLGGNPVSNGGSATAVDGQLSAVATPASNYSFVGWVNLNTNELLSSSASATLNVPQNMNLHAVFVKRDGTSNAWFLVDGTKLFNDLDVAVQEASSIIVLAADGTLPAGNYTIPSGVTLLIPRDAAHTVDKTTPATTKPTNFGTTPPAPTSFRKLTMANGANISVSGAISIAGTQWAGGMYVSVTGAAGFVHMNSGSTITVNNGGNLYAWGYITGSGSVTAKSGATIYEHFQVAGWRGGDMTSTMINSNTYGVFPMSQYYVQNIEVPLKLESGAVENTYASASISVIGIQPISVAFVGTDNAMFKITSGYVIKDYIEGEDRLKIEIYGDVSLTPIEINMKLGIWGSVSLKTAEFVLPINNNMTIHAVSGNMAIDQDAALLPGTQVIIDAEAKCTIGNGVSLYVYSSAEWGTYCGSVNKTFIAVAHAPGRTYTRTAADLVDASVCVNGTVDASQGYIYTTESGANIFSTGNGVIKLNAGTQEYTYQVVQAGEPADSAYPAIPITSAKLKNGDGSYVETSSATSVTAYTYCPACLEWEYDGTGFVNHATNVELGNGLNMYFAFWGDNISDGHYVVVRHGDEEIPFTSDRWLTTSIKVNGTEIQKNAYVVYYNELSAKQMGDIITVTLYTGSGDVVDTWSNSIQHYAMRMLKKYEADTNKGTLRTLLVDMLNYGAACQKEFGYDTDNLVNAGLSAVQQGWATKTVAWSETLPAGSTNNKANLIVDGNIQFAISGVNDLSRYSFKNHWGTQRDDQKFKPADGYFYISKLYVADARQVITITAGNTTWTDSIEAYCKRIIDSKQDTNGVCTAFMKFSDAAKAYLEGGNRI